jgi:hypothetical protein
MFIFQLYFNLSFAILVNGEQLSVSFTHWIEKCGGGAFHRKASTYIKSLTLIHYPKLI